MFKVIENRFFSVIFEWYQHALASMIYWKNCLKTILYNRENELSWPTRIFSNCWCSINTYKLSRFNNPDPFKGLGLSLYDYKYLYFFLICDLSYLILRMYTLVRKRVNRAITPYFLRLNHVYNKIKDKKDK